MQVVNLGATSPSISMHYKAVGGTYYQLWNFLSAGPGGGQAAQNPNIVLEPGESIAVGSNRQQCENRRRQPAVAAQSSFLMSWTITERLSTAVSG